jgi:cobalt/nickel transport system permease protein
MTLAFDQIAPTEAGLGQLDARWKLAALVPAAAAAAILYTLPAATVAFVLAVGLALAGGLSSRWFASRLLRLAPLLVLFSIWLPFMGAGDGPTWTLGPFTLSVRGFQVACLLCLKALTILALMLVLLGSTAVNDALQAARALYVPGILIHLLLLTFRYLEVFAAELSRLRVALRVRGYRNRANVASYRTIGHITGALLVRSSERAERVGQAMRCRGFDGRFRSLAQFRTTVADVAFFTLMFGAAATLLAWDFLLR